jgi:hypothetical protein
MVILWMIIEYGPLLTPPRKFEIMGLCQPTTPQRSSAAFLAGKKTSPFFFGRNIARVKIVP